MGRKPSPAPAPIDPIGDHWARTWGETVTKTVAAKMLGVCRCTVYEWINAGYLPTAPNGNVLVRPAAAWANSSQRLPKQKKRLRAL